MLFKASKRLASIPNLKQLPTQKIIPFKEEFHDQHVNFSFRLFDFALGKVPFLFTKMHTTNNSFVKRVSLYNFMSCRIFHNAAFLNLYKLICASEPKESFPEVCNSPAGRILLYHTTNHGVTKLNDTAFINPMIVSVLIIVQIPYMVPLMMAFIYHEVLHSLAIDERSEK